MNEKSVSVKVCGSSEAVKKFIEQLDIQYFILKTPLLLNDKDSGVHCFVTLNPFSIEVKKR